MMLCSSLETDMVSTRYPRWTSAVQTRETPLSLRVTHVRPPGEKSSRRGEGLKASAWEPLLHVEPLFPSWDIQWDSHQSDTFLEAEGDRKSPSTIHT